MSTKRTLLAAAAVTVTAAVAGVAASAGAGSGSAKHEGKSLAGAWNVIVKRPAPLPPLASLQVFTKEGSVVESSEEPPATRTPQIGVWQRIGDHLYAASAMVFRFDALGNHVSTVRINRNIRLSHDGQSFRQAARATTYDLQGNVLTSIPVAATGERMQIEHIPDQP